MIFYLEKEINEKKVVIDDLNKQLIVEKNNSLDKSKQKSMTINDEQRMLEIYQLEENYEKLKNTINTNQYKYNN